MRLKRLLDSMTDRISFLTVLVETLDLYEVLSDRPPVAPAPVGIATRQRPQVAFNNYGTVGTLNTGEVLGSIHSHVSTATGLSAVAFREAVEAFAESIDQNRELSEDQRKVVLESIDFAAEEANRPPEKRRLSALGAVLATIPAALSLSANALEAWDKYGPSIQAHLGLQ